MDRDSAEHLEDAISALDFDACPADLLRRWLATCPAESWASALFLTDQQPRIAAVADRDTWAAIADALSVRRMALAQIKQGETAVREALLALLAADGSS
jgi:hypothetical protein